MMPWSQNKRNGLAWPYLETAICTDTVLSGELGRIKLALERVHRLIDMAGCPIAWHAGLDEGGEKLIRPAGRCRCA